MRNIQKKTNDVLIESKNFCVTLIKIQHLLEKSGNNPQANFISKLIELIYKNEFDLFVKSLNSVNMWGGAGAVWEVYFENKEDGKDFEREMIKLIDLMEKTKIIGKGIRPIKKIFTENLEQ